MIHVMALFMVVTFQTVSADTTRFDALIKKYSDYYAVDFNLIKAMIRQESNFKIRAVSPADAHGLMQMIPATAKRFGVTDVYSPDQSIRGGTQYIRWLLDRYSGNVDFALAGYNAGEGKVDRYKGIPPYKETRNYVKRVKRFYRTYQDEGNDPQVAASKRTISKQNIAAIATSLYRLFNDQPLPAIKPKITMEEPSSSSAQSHYLKKESQNQEVGIVTRVYAIDRRGPASGYTRIRGSIDE